MAAVLAKVDGDAVGTGLLANDGGGDDARLDGFAGLADRGDVVDVYVEFGSQTSNDACT